MANETTVGRLLEEDGGDIQTGPFGTKLKAAEYTPDGVPVISVGEVGYGRLRLHEKTPRVNETVTGRMPEYLLRTNDIVFGRKGAVDRSAIVLPEQDGWFLGSDGIRLRLPTTCDAEFIAYQLQEPRHRQWMIQHAAGTTMASLNESIIRSIPLVLPPLGEQRAIAGVLGALDDKIEQNRRTAGVLERLARAIFRAWFIDFEPVHAKATGADSFPGMPQEVFDTLPAGFEDSELGPIPQGWEAGSLGDVATEVRIGAKPDEIDPETPYIGLEHMPQRCIALSEWETAAKVTSNKSRFHAGQILFGKLRPYFHKVGIAPVDGVCSTDVVVIEPTKPVHFGMTLGMISSDAFVAYTTACSTGTKMPRTKWGDMKGYRVPLSPNEVLQAFADIIAPIAGKIVADIHESRTLAALRDYLLPKLLSGQVRVSAAAECASEAEEAMA